MERYNNFDLLRLTFALMVMVYHIYAVTALPALSWFGDLASGRIGVEGFFVISGFLITQSYERTDSLIRYAVKRIRRIYPAYVTVILLSAMVGAAISSSVNIWDAQVGKYILANLSFLNFLQPSLPGLFTDHPNTSSINGSLWTLKVEVLFYAAIPIIIWLMRRTHILTVGVIIYLCSVIYHTGLLYLAGGDTTSLYTKLARQLPGQMVFFIIGMLSYYYLQWMTAHKKPLCICALLLLLIDLYFQFNLFRPLWVGAFVVGVAFWLPYLGNVAKYGDLSYGIYILHFPIIQLALHYDIFAYNHYVGVLTVSCFSIILAWLLWHVVEKKFLFSSSHYKQM